jgi:hypothetical protein
VHFPCMQNTPISTPHLNVAPASPKTSPNVVARIISKILANTVLFGSAAASLTGCGLERSEGPSATSKHNEHQPPRREVVEQEFRKAAEKVVDPAARLKLLAAEEEIVDGLLKGWSDAHADMARRWQYGGHRLPDDFDKTFLSTHVGGIVHKWKRENETPPEGK